ncbi:hypothetical protein M5E89_04590 [Acidaminococcus intestini]|nr:hypothetical protein M5E89_04590 [Acidaminococcus intestini]
MAAKERQLSEKKARIQVIQNMERDHDGFSRGVKTILQSKAGWRSGICGVVGELLHVEGRYVTAIETALGGALQNIITRDAQTAKEAIRHLKSQKGGRATFLPLDTIRPRSLSPKEKEALKAPGIIGLASSLVSVDADLMPAVDFLLGQVLVAETLDQALDAAKRADMRVRVVTLEGDVIYSGGSLAGGEKENRRSFLSRHQELETHQKERAQLEKSWQDLTKPSRKSFIRNRMQSLTAISVPIPTRNWLFPWQPCPPKWNRPKRNWVKRMKVFSFFPMKKRRQRRPILP